MKKIGLIYWPKGGNVENTARNIFSRFNPGSIQMFDIRSVDKEKLSHFDYFIVGGSTVGADNWQDTSDTNFWTDFFRIMADIDLSNKKVALFGLGDQVLYPNHFVDGLANLYREFMAKGAVICGFWPVDGYEFYDSEAVESNNFVGLVIDEDQQPELTDDRVKRWTDTIKKDFVL